MRFRPFRRQPPAPRPSDSIEATEELVWTWGFGAKNAASLADLKRIAGLQPNDPAPEIPDFDEQTRARMWRRWGTAPMPTSFFQSESWKDALKRIVNGANTRNLKVKRLVFEDHGFKGILFQGADAITADNFSRYENDFVALRKVLTPHAKIILIHCQAFADGGEIGALISRATQRRVYGMDVDQKIGNRRIEGQAFVAHNGRVSKVGDLEYQVLHFD